MIFSKIAEARIALLMWLSLKSGVSMDRLVWVLYPDLLPRMWRRMSEARAGGSALKSPK